MREFAPEGFGVVHRREKVGPDAVAREGFSCPFPDSRHAHTAQRANVGEFEHSPEEDFHAARTCEHKPVIRALSQKPDTLRDGGVVADGRRDDGGEFDNFRAVAPQEFGEYGAGLFRTRHEYAHARERTLFVPREFVGERADFPHDDDGGRPRASGFQLRERRGNPPLRGGRTAFEYRRRGVGGHARAEKPADDFRERRHTHEENQRPANFRQRAEIDIKRAVVATVPR